ncbi:hypothetical protein Dimus_021703 [Dionaea muscipula]
MKNDFDLEKSPDVSATEQEQGRVRVPGNENVVEERGRSEATTSSGNSDETGVPPGFNWPDMESGGGSGSGGGRFRVLGDQGGVGESIGDFERIRFSTGDDVKGVEEFEVASTSSSGRVESRVTDMNHGVKSEMSGYDFSNHNSRSDGYELTSVSGGNHGVGGSSTMGVKDVYDQDTGEKGSYRFEKRAVSQYDSWMGNASSDAGGVWAGSSKVRFGFEMGDMVWGKVKSHPWWPGQIFNEALASSHVRRTRRNGHALVAFFGDSSYGWFEAEDLIPYEPNYVEKSQQTNSKNFMKAVEESEDEVSRRAALGLSCRCRNPYNFRLTNVLGYFSIDVVDYEPGGIYSVGQISRARYGFQPGVLLSFVKQLALAPKDVERRSIDFIKNKSMSLAYRRAIFEEFDETYAQAFGQQPVRAARLSPSVIGQSAKDVARGLLSGPQVFADGGKNSVKAVKSKEHAKKDRYLLKRRDEPDSRTHQIGQGNLTSLSPAYENELSVSAARDYVMQRRELAVSASEEQALTPRRNEVAASSVAIGGNASGGGPARMDGPNISVKGLSTGLDEQYGPTASVGQEPDRFSRGPDSGKKIKAAKRPAGKFDPEVKKKRKKVEAEWSSDDPRKQSLDFSGKLVGEPKQTATATATALREDSNLSHQRRGVETASSLSAAPPMGQMPLGGFQENEVELPELLGDLQALALNPLHGAGRNRPAIVRQVFLTFRSLVFQKSLAVVPAITSEPQEARAVRPPPSSGSGPPANANATSGGENIRSMPPLSKPSRPLSRLDDPTRAGKKRSQRPEETAAKRVKKTSDAKPSGVEKRSVQKDHGMLHADGRGNDAAAAQPVAPPKRTAKAGSLRRAEPPQRVEEPTFLMIKFPPGSSLPTSMELKARFARFGSMDSEGNRVFYKTTTCRVLFLYKQDAERAQQYADSIFPNVKLHLKPLSGRGEDTTNEQPTAAQPPAAGLPKSILKKPTGDETTTSVRGTRVRFNMGEETTTSVREVQTMDYRNNNSSSFQEATGTSSVAMDLSSNQKVISASSHPLLSLPMPMPMPQQPLPPLLPFPPPPPPWPLLSRATHNQQHIEVGPPRVNNNYNHHQTIGLPSQAPTDDISGQMIDLLMRCDEIVASLTTKLGYVPYHPL